MLKYEFALPELQRVESQLKAGSRIRKYSTLALTTNR